jgi:PilZ domain
VAVPLHNRPRSPLIRSAPDTVSRSGKEDRRGAARYETAAPLWGALGLSQELRLRNLSAGGLLVESPHPVPADTVHRVALPFVSGGQELRARVCHVRRETRADGSSTYLVGMEFVAAPPTLIAEIELLVAAGLRSLEEDDEKP